MTLHLARQMWRRCLSGTTAGACAIAVAGGASAEALHTALAHAYRHNPVLAAERAELRVVAEDINEARAPGRPRISVLTSHTETVKKAIPSTLNPERTLRSDLSVSVPLYRGGTVKYAVLDARSRYQAGWETLRATTAGLLGTVVIAYCDVLRDEAIIRFSERDIAVLEANLRGARGRFDIGDLTATDVALSEARLEQARSNLFSARAQLIASREEYVRVVGLAPQNLEEPPPLADLPASVDAAIDAGMRANGDLLASRLQVRAAEYRIRAAQGERDVRVTAVSSSGYYDYLNSVSSTLPFRPNMNGSSVQLGVTMEVPLFQGGLPASRVRRAREARASAMEQEIAAGRGVVAQVRAAYANWQMMLASEKNAMAAVEAAERALKGAKAENNVGTRTLLDVLDAEREVLRSQIALVTLRRNAYVAAFALLTTTGRADPERLGLPGPAMPVAGPPAPRASWSDWADGARHYRPAGTATDTIPAQDGQAD